MFCSSHTDDQINFVIGPKTNRESRLKNLIKARKFIEDSTHTEFPLYLWTQHNIKHANNWLCLIRTNSLFITFIEIGGVHINVERSDVCTCKASYFELTYKCYYNGFSVFLIKERFNILDSTTPSLTITPTNHFGEFKFWYFRKVLRAVKNTGFLRCVCNDYQNIQTIDSNGYLLSHPSITLN